MRGRALWIPTLFVLLVTAILTQPRRPAIRVHFKDVESSRPAPALSTDRQAQPESLKKPQRVESYGKLPLSFEANRGQTDPEVRFLSRGSGYMLFLTPTEGVLALRKPVPPEKQDRGNVAAGFSSAQSLKGAATPAPPALVLRMKLAGANPAPQVRGLEQLPGKSHYFIGNDPAGWRINIPTFAKVKYTDIYPGVDLVYYGNQRQLEYDFVVAPGADPRAIRLTIAGAEKLEMDAGRNVVLRTTGGEVRLHKPIVYQQADGARKEIAGRYVLLGKRQVGFEVAAYDASKPLIIDPVLSYSTYLGGSAEDLGNAIGVDASGNAYVTGSTRSLNFPTKNSVQTALAGGSDVFVTKLDPTGSTLVYSTYLGGSADESGNGIAVDGSGNAYVTGSTNSANFPTKNPFQPALGGGSDAFVAKLDPTGSLIYSTYLGGSGNESGKGIAVDGLGNAYITGATSSTNFPTANAFQAALKAPADAFVAKIDTTKSGSASLVYSTYLGGSGNDSGAGIALDASGNAYVTGQTGSSDFPITTGVFRTSFGNASQLIFAAKIDPSKSGAASLIYSTYLGGSNDGGSGIAVDTAGNAYITGLTGSTNFSTTSGSFMPTTLGIQDAFVIKLNLTASAMVYSTYLGGSGNDEGQAIAVDAAGNAYVTGLTESHDFPLASPIQSSLVFQTCLDYYYGSFPCGNTAFVTVLNAAGSAAIYSTYLGASGGNFESGSGIALDTAGNVYVTGRATSNFPLTPGAFQLAPGGSGDAFVAKIGPNNAPGFSLSSFSLSLPDEGIGGTTAPQPITLTNSGSATLTITSIAPSGDFAETNTCGSSLAGAASCTINVTFTPTAAGARSGTITITDSVASSPQKVTLSGVGIAGLAATLSPSSLSFSNQTVGTSSAQQVVTLKNTGSAALTINGFSLAGTNPSDFSFSSTCNQGQSLAVGASCTFSISFSPQAVGNRSATLQILDNSAQSPRTVAMTGAAIPPPTVTLSPTTLIFAAQVVGTPSAGQLITLSTSGSGTLAISGISSTIGDFVPSSTCGTSVAGGANCTITVTFNPRAAGNITGKLVIVDNATSSPQTVSLSGMGTDFSISPAAGSPSSATVTAGQTATFTVSAVGTSGFNGTVSLSCTSPAVQSTCGVSPNSLMLSGTTAVNAILTVMTTARSALPPSLRPPIVSPGLRVVLPWLLLFLSLVILIRALRRRSRRRRAWVGLAAILMAAALFFGCGGGAPSSAPQGTLAGTYTITVTGTSGGASRSTSVNLTVN